MKRPVWITHPAAAGSPDRFERWIYLGQGVEAYRQIRHRLGTKREWSYDGQLRETANEFRQPFLDFVAEVGAVQRDPVTWWSTRFSWKLWTASDLFLLTCYLATAESLIEEAVRGGFSLLVLVEDPWLLRQLKENLKTSQPHVRVEGGGLWAERAKRTFLGMARRGWWLFTVLRNAWRQKRIWPSRAVPVPEGPAAALFSYPSKSAFEIPGRWHDSHLPRMDRILSGQGDQVIRFSPPECGGWEREIAERSSYAYPLILWTTAARLLRSLGAFWRPRWPERLQVKGRSIRWLCLREWWLEIGRSSLCAYRLFYECLNGMLSQGRWRHLVTFYENQPWEKLQVLAARAHGVSAIGIQTTHFSRYHLSFALGRGEEERLPLPDRIGTSGSAAHRLLLDCGIPAGILRRFGALRYGHLAGPLSRGDGRPADGAGNSGVLVVLSIDPILSRHLLEGLHRSFPNGGAGDGLHFVIRPHPMHPIPRHWIRFPARLVSSTFANLQEDLDACGTVLFTASTIGFDALAAGKSVLRYRSPRLFDVDEMYGSLLPVATDSNLRDALLRQVRAGPHPESHEETRRWIVDSFAPVDEGSLAGFFSDRTCDSPEGILAR